MTWVTFCRLRRPTPQHRHRHSQAGLPDRRNGDELQAHAVEDRARYGRVRTDRESVRVLRERMLYEREVGTLVELAEVHRANMDAMGPILARLDALPARIMQHISASDAHAVQQAVSAEIAEMRSETARVLRSLAESARGKTKH